MFQDLDDTLESLFADPAAPVEVRGALKDFLTPYKNFLEATDEARLNLFPCQVKENREPRDPARIVQRINGEATCRRAPLRVQCSDVVTAWSKWRDDTGAIYGGLSR